MSDAPKLEPFNKNAVCQMCGSSEISSEYHDDKGYRSHYTCSAVPLFGAITTPEHIERTCTRCHFRWPEATLRLAYQNGEAF